MDSSSAARKAELSDDGLQPDAFEQDAPLTALILPYAFAKRHGVLIGQIDDDAVNVLHRGSPDPIVLAEVRRITRQLTSSLPLCWRRLMSRPVTRRWR